MAVLITITTVLPNKEVKFFNQNNEFKDLFEVFNTEKNKYKVSGKLLSESTDRTADGLTVSYAGLWKSQADLDEFNNNIVLKQYWNERNKHNKLNNIIQTKKIIEV